MAITANEVEQRYPIHWLVWNNRHDELKQYLEANKYTPEDLELKDPRGRTPLLLAVTLGYIEAVRLLLEAGADVNCEKDGWTAVQEATATGDQELLSLVLSRRDYQRHVLRAGGIPDLLRRLSLAPDFYVEMKWEFTSWVPLVSRMCPFDTYKVYKRGGNVRVDTTLVGFENNRWQRGDRTYIFRGQGRSASLVELDHAAGTVWCEALHGEGEGEAGEEARAPPPRMLARRLAAPLAINYLDTDKICFERNKSGIWGWRQDKLETVNGYECKVFSANNVELVSKTRSEHLPRGKRAHTPRAPLAGLLALADDPPPLEEEEEPPTTPQSSRSREDLTVEPVTWEEYFSGEALDRDIGRSKLIETKVQKFKATLWLCEEYPLEAPIFRHSCMRHGHGILPNYILKIKLQEQIMPILDLMAAISSPHFVKLKDFVQMQLPAGFPVKIEIPLFHVLNARITFGNIFATETPVPHIECIQEGDRLSCVIDDACFNIGSGYRDALAPDERLACCDDEESLLQYAIQQSLMEAGTSDDQVDVWEALRGARPVSPASPAAPAPPAPPARSPPYDTLRHDAHLQRAIEASLASLASGGALPAPVTGAPVAVDDAECDEELARVLALSAREHAARDEQFEAEQRALEEALRLSLLEK